MTTVYRLHILFISASFMKTKTVYRRTYLKRSTQNAFAS